MNLDLKGKNAVVGGGSQGIGLAIAIELAALGANCTLLARHEEALQAALLQLDQQHGQQHGYIVADYSLPETVKTSVELLAENRVVHILINNTGGPAGGPIADAKAADFLAAFNQHLICNHLLANTVIPGMKQDGYGRIINIISTSVKVPLPNLGVSNTIRGAVASWAKTMSNELAQWGITVNNVLPGATLTRRLESIIDAKAAKTGMGNAAIEEEMLSEIPARRFGRASEIAAVAAFLASPAAAYVTGVSIPVDGGRTGAL
jgi:3-oxoacyl-[acyl-carrier protein] reductase